MSPQSPDLCARCEEPKPTEAVGIVATLRKEHRLTDTQALVVSALCPPCRATYLGWLRTRARPVTE